MFPKLYSVRLVNELESVVAVRVFYSTSRESSPIYEEFQVKINHAHLFEKIEEVKDLQSNSTIVEPLVISENVETSQQVVEASESESQSSYYIDKIQVFLGEGQEEKMWTFDSPFLTYDSNNETFVISRDRKGEVELRHLREKELKTKYDYSEVFGNSSDDILGY